MHHNRVFSGIAMRSGLMMALTISSIGYGWAAPLPFPTAQLSANPQTEVSVSNGLASKQIINSNAAANVTIKLPVAPADADNQGALYLAASMGSSWYRLDKSGSWVPWNIANPGELTPWTEKSLAALEQIEFTVPAKGFLGSADLYAGYHRNGSAEYFSNTQPLTFSSYTSRLSTTGVSKCASFDKIDLECSDPQVVNFPGQDAVYTTNPTKYTKIDASGNLLTDASATTWSCVKDNLTGLWWEVKKGSSSADLQNQDNLYTWINGSTNNNGGSPGVLNGGSCIGSLCDTNGYTAAVNAINLCGKNDWRLPTLQELQSLVDNSRFAPAINPDYFPNTPAFDYWTSTPRAVGSNDAWSVYFYYGGVTYGSNKNTAYRIRLVRTGD